MLSRQFPFSIAVFLFTAVVFVLQLIPFIGGFFWMFGAMFWSILTVNLAFLLVVVDCKLGRLPYWFLIIPIIWFGGYWSAHLIGQQQVQAFSDQANAAGVNRRIAPLANDEDIIIESRPMSALRAKDIIEKYDLSVVYERVPDENKCGPIQSVRLQPSGCGELSNQQIAVSTDNNAGCKPILSPVSEYSISKRETRLLKGICAISEQKNPDRNVVRVSVSATEGVLSRFLLGGTAQTIKIERDTSTASIISGTLKPLPWFPAPILGCILGQCVVEFDRPKEVRLGALYQIDDQNAAERLAGILDLKRTLVSERFPLP